VTLHDPATHLGLREIYRRARLFALPGQIAKDGDRDSIPNVLAEAMGLPVISTNISGIPELITDQVDGLLIPQSGVVSEPCVALADITAQASSKSLRVPVKSRSCYSTYKNEIALFIHAKAQSKPHKKTIVLTIVYQASKFSFGSKHEKVKRHKRIMFMLKQTRIIFSLLGMRALLTNTSWLSANQYVGQRFKVTG